MGSIRKRTCLDCGAVHHVLHHHRHGIMSQDNADIDDLRCPACKGERYTEGFPDGPPPRDEITNGRTMFPYYDVNLGMHLESAAHKRRVLKERGLVEMEGEMSTVLEKQLSEDERREAESKADYEEYQRECAADPEIRRLQARFDEIRKIPNITPDEVRRRFYGR